MNRYVFESFSQALVVMVAVTICGCSAIVVPSPSDVIKTPLGTESIKIGMTKQQIESIWGRPDNVKTVEDSKRWSGTREVWVYRAQYGSIPVNAGYFSQNRKLYFDGVNLTEIE